jgi:hypothetical protein
VPTFARRGAVFVLALVAGGELVAEARANPVNAESLRPNPLQEGVSGMVDGTVALSRGNIELLDVSGAARLQVQSLHPAPPAQPGARTPAAKSPPFVRHSGFVTTSGRFATRNATTFVSQAFVHARWTGMWHPRAGTELFTQVSFNEFLRLRARALAGVGVRVVPVHREHLMLWGGSGYMLEGERIDVAEGALDEPTTLAHRWSSYVTLRATVLAERLLLQSTTYVQPRFDALADLRLLEEAEVLARVSARFALGVTFSALLDTRPPTAVEPLDLRLGSTVRWSF